VKRACVASVVILAAAIAAGVFVARERAATVPAPVVATAKPPEAPPAFDRAGAAVAAANSAGIDMTGGFVEEGDFQLVRAHCTVCHSSKLVLQNRASREGWQKMIRWMQERHRLWDLGEHEPRILDYLAKHYGPVEQGRRAPIQVKDWYELEPPKPAGS
jgi:cytochrome c1